VALEPGETRKVKVTVDAKFLSVFDEATNGWKLIPGVYTFRVGSSSRDLALTTTMAVQ
jgi:beta-glucosidase